MTTRIAATALAGCTGTGTDGVGVTYPNRDRSCAVSQSAKPVPSF